MSEQRPLVSVIVPVYNVEKYLRQCLDSLISQTLQNIEIICVNDASPDNSLSILEEYAAKDERVVVVDLKENIRQGGARNRGIERARAEYIAFVDSDDWVANDMYEKLYKAAVENEADIVFGNNWNYKNENDIRERVGVKDSLLFNACNDDLNKELIMRGFYIVTNLYKKCLFISNNIYFPEHTFYEDTAIAAVLCCLATRKVYVNIPLYYYRLNNNSTSRKKNDDRFYERLDTAIMFVDNMKHFGFYDKYKDEVDYLFIINFYDAPIFGSLFSFSTPQLDRIKQIKKRMKEFSIGLSDNTYYSKEAVTFRQLVVKIVTLNTYLAIPVFYTYPFLKKLKKIIRSK